MASNSGSPTRTLRYRYAEERLVDWIEFNPPMDIDFEFALLWNYRRALTVIEMLKQDVRVAERRRSAAEVARDEMGKLLQRWIEDNPVKKTAA